jgi:hypothetical protein
MPNAAAFAATIAGAVPHEPALTGSTEPAAPRPGPWAVEYDEMFDHWVVRDANHKIIVGISASVRTVDRSDPAVDVIRKAPIPSAEPTARLIAASIKLRDALAGLVSAWSSTSGMGTVYEIQRALPDALAVLAEIERGPQFGDHIASERDWWPETNR